MPEITPELQQETAFIATGGRERDFEPIAIDIIPAPNLEGSRVFPLFYTNLHMLPGEPSPRLKRTDIPNMDIPDDSRQTGIDICLARLAEHTPLITADETADEAVEWIAAACQEIESRGSDSSTNPFTTISVFALYFNESGPLSLGFASRSFVDILKHHIPKEGGKISETVLKLGYGLDKKDDHRGDIISYEDWLRDYEAQTGDDIQSLVANTLISYLMLPGQPTHPALKTKLFENK